MEDTLSTLGNIISQFNYYFDVKIPDLSEIKGIEKVIVCGMGGSAFPADIVSDHIKQKYKRELVYVNRSYNLPYWADETTLIIATSFSGSTEETLSCMTEALERKIPLIGLSMGGEISRICSEKNIPYISLPKVVMPRFGVGFLVSALTRLCVELKLIPRQDEEIRNIQVLIEPLKIHAQKSAEELSLKIKGRIINIYTDEQNSSIGRIARICVNETGKTVGYFNNFSESNHNELASYENTPYPHAMLLLTYPNIHKRIVERFDLVKEILKDKNIVFEKINSNFDDILYRDIYFTLFFSYLGYYIAVNSNFDPVSIPSQEELKILLKRTK